MPDTSSSPSPSLARTALSSVREAWRAGRRWLIATAVLQLALALLPALQVVLVAHALATMATPSTAWPSMLGLAAVVGIAFPLGQCATAATQRLALRMRLAYQLLALEYVAAAEPAALASPATIEAAQTAHEAAATVDTVAGDVVRLAGSAVTAVALSVAVVAINPFAGLLVLASLVPTVWVFTRIARAEEAGWPKVGAAERRAQYAAEQLLQQRTGTELATLGSSWKVVELAHNWRREAVRILDDLMAVAMRWEAVSGVLTALLLAGALMVLLLGEPSPAAAAAALTGTISGLHATRNVGYAVGGIVTAAPRMSAIDACRARPVHATVNITSPAYTLSARGITVRYPGTAAKAVDQASISATRGEMIAIVGPNGAGKSTLVNALLGVVPAEGTVEIDGVDVSASASRDRIGHFGLLTQEFGRYEFTVRENVALGHPGTVADKAIAQALAQAHAARLVARLPRGLDSQLGQQWHGTGLSGGQWQRLALARIHLRNAGIWILDEPTSAIDAETEEAIFAELHSQRAQRITVVVSHRAWTLRAMDRIYVMDEGRIVQQGSYDELLRTPGRFAEIFALQTRSAGEGTR